MVKLSKYLQDRHILDTWSGSHDEVIGGGFGVALIESFDVDRVSPEKLVEMAQRQGIDLRSYQV